MMTVSPDDRYAYLGGEGEGVDCEVVGHVVGVAGAGDDAGLLLQRPPEKHLREERLCNVDVTLM